ASATGANEDLRSAAGATIAPRWRPPREATSQQSDQRRFGQYGAGEVAGDVILVAAAVQASPQSRRTRTQSRGVRRVDQRQTFRPLVEVRSARIGDVRMRTENEIVT